MDAFMPFDVNSEAIEGVDWYDRHPAETLVANMHQVQDFHRPSRIMAVIAQMSCQLLHTPHVPLLRHFLG